MAAYDIIHVAILLLPIPPSRLSPSASFHRQLVTAEITDDSPMALQAVKLFAQMQQDVIKEVGLA